MAGRTNTPITVKRPTEFDLLPRLDGKSTGIEPVFQPHYKRRIPQGIYLCNVTTDCPFCEIEKKLNETKKTKS